MNILQMLVPDQYIFPGSWGYTRRWLVLHKTAGFHSAQEVAAYFQSGSNGLEVSSHYVIGQDGMVVQCVNERDGAGANGLLEAGHAAFWPIDLNINLVTFSIEHVDPSIDNSTPLTDAQKHSSFELIHAICERWTIPMRPADAGGGITGHFSIDPISRARCPGNYPWDELWTYLKGEQHMPIPQGWRDDGTRLIAPNKHYLVKGFRDHVLNDDQWQADDQPLEEEQRVSRVELHTDRGAGTRQLTDGHLLVWTQAMGVKESACGQEIAACYNLAEAQKQQIAGLKAQIFLLKTSPAGVDQTALNQAHSQIIDLQHKISLAQENLK